MSQLNIFHQEVLSFLQTDAESSKLDEILENYRHLIGEPSFVHLERQWMNSLSAKEFTDAGLLPYFPKIYRGLPRIYHRNHPSQSRIDSHFTNLHALKKFSVDKALYSLYGDIDPSWMRISIVCWVIPDGYGDWVAALDTARIIKEKWPHLEIELYFISARPLPPCTDFPITYLSCLEDVSLEMTAKLRQSDLILQIPTFFPQTKQLMEQIRSLPSPKPNPIWKNIGEYGFLQSSWFHPKSSNYSMGLHALEKGVLTYEPKPSSFAEIEQKNLLLWMFDTSGPSSQEIEAYTQTHHFHLAYLATPVGGAIYLHSLLKMHEKDNLDIDLCCPDLTWLGKWNELQNHQGLMVLQETFGVSAMEVHTPIGMQRITFQGTGKRLRLFCPGVLSRSDMKKLFVLSGDWVAVRGDQSFSEAVSSNKPFFYDGRNHAKYFMKDLLALAQNRLREHRSATEAFRLIGQASLWNYSEESDNWVDENYFQQAEKMDWFEVATLLGNCLQNPDTSVGFKKLCQIVTQEHSFNPFLCHLMQRTACHAKQPAIKQMEALQTNLYLHGAISFTTLMNNLTKEISHGFYRPHETDI